MSQLRRDLISSYALSLSRIGSWAAVFAIVWRQLGPEAFAVLALARSTIGILRVTGLGLGPATLRLLAEEQAGEVAAARRAEKGTFLFSARSSSGLDALPAAENRNVPFSAGEAEKTPDPFSAAERSEASGEAVLEYQNIYTDSRPRVHMALVWGRRTGVAVVVLGLLYAALFPILHEPPDDVWIKPFDLSMVVGWLAVAAAFRCMSDPVGAFLAANKKLWLDNCVGTVAELVWPILLLVTIAGGVPSEARAHALAWVSVSAAIAEFAGWAARRVAARQYTWRTSQPFPLRRLLTLGGLVTLAQAADYLYAPVDYILLNRFVPGGIETYAPAVMFDSALLLVGSGIAAVILPYSALADARGDTASVRRQYLKGTAASVALLVVGAIVIWLAAPLVFHLWLGQDLPDTRAILPLVLLHTIIGGSGAVGRSVLLGMGRAKALAASVLVAGAVNVLISTAAVLLGFGLVGVIAGTLIATFGRCVVWMPWYVLRKLGSREVGELGRSDSPTSQLPNSPTPPLH